ncbi:MAG: flap endonuclease-1 [Candidatus Hodarchaeales archaeon]|jgi:flap endonuclease-1
MGTQIGKLLVNSRLNIQISDLSGMKIGFDAYNMIYAFLARIRNQSRGGALFTDDEGRTTSHLMGLFPRLTHFFNNKIQPVFIFDGKPPVFKEAEISTRKQLKIIAKQKQQVAISQGEMEEAMKYAQATSKITPEILEDAKRLLSYFGIPIIQAPSEAEAQGAWMTTQGQIDAMASQDYDSFLFGCPQVIRNIGISQRRKLPNQPKFVDVPTEKISLQDLLTELNLKNRTQLILLGLLIGTDYNPKGIKGVGPKTALKLVKQYPTLESLLKYLDSRYKIQEVFPFPPQKLVEYFHNPEVVEINEPTIGNPSPKKIQSFLVDERDFRLERIERQIKSLHKLSNQSTLDSFFQT